MKSNVFYRDFTLCKAALLAGLIGAAALMGEMPHPSQDHVDIEPAEARIVPVKLLIFWKDCDETETGVTL
ncbi:hypothetical protein KUH32_14055 [Thalassococcus sp. CAU 1522]|uniref:Uncharacterized protein n=1 Tax=Thalassococcus arenae TaxID=2851652 RepID=A0ABS6NB32_9RHOB|nr:hypothetical protein [Thalassococcus arenae]MBV2360887.1 hypothetical protein [Thalassococcus arenae]